MKTVQQQESSGAGSASAPAKKQKTRNCKDNEEEPEVAAATATAASLGLLRQEPVPIQSFTSTEQRVWRGICRELHFLENQEVHQNDRTMFEERVRILCDEQIEKYPQLTQIHSEETACLLQRFLATNDSSWYFESDDRPTVALDHCTEGFAAQVVKKLIRKNPSALVWPQVKNWIVDLEGEILTFDQKPIINIVSRVHPPLMIWVARTYPSILESVWTLDGRNESIGYMVSRSIARYGSADTIFSFFKEYPSSLAPGKRIPVILLCRLRLSSQSFDIRKFESIVSTLKWVERTSPESIVSNLYDVLRELAWAISEHSCYNLEQSTKGLLELARFFLQKYPLSLIRNDDNLRLYHFLYFLRNPQTHPVLVKYLFMVLRLLHANGFDILEMLDAQRSLYMNPHHVTRRGLEDFHKARNLVDLICQEGQISHELGRLRLAAAYLQSSSHYSDVAEVFQSWSKTRSDVAFSSHARVKAIFYEH